MFTVYIFVERKYNMYDRTLVMAFPNIVLIVAGAGMGLSVQEFTPSLGRAVSRRAERLPLQ